MNRRRYLAGGVAGTLTLLAGCTETLTEIGETVDSALEDDDAVATGEVHRSPKSFRFDAWDGAIIRVSPHLRNEGTGRGEITLYGPNGNEVDSTRINLDGRQMQSWETFDAVADGEHRVSVDPSGDRDARIRIRITVDDN